MDLLPLLVFFSVPLLLAAPFGVREGWRRFVVEALRWLMVVWVPLIVFFLSTGMSPEWKGEATFGALSCWIEGKIWLTPMVVWACAALYAGALGYRGPGWVAGLVSGGIAATSCAVYGLVVMPKTDGPTVLFLLVPVYTAVVYVRAAVLAVRDAGISRWSVAAVGAVGLPSFILSAVEAQKIYAELPEEPPECFVVTAASHGDPAVVGPFFVVLRNGRLRRANAQLLRFWAFEARWSAVSPWTHAAFRTIYGWVGPLVARRLQGRVRATCAWRALRVVERVIAPADASRRL
jgi:hypothetical protein